MSGCPSHDTLQLFAASELSAEEVETIGEHLSCCEKCQEWLDGVLRFSSSASFAPSDHKSTAVDWDAGVSQRLLAGVQLRVRSEADSQPLPEIPGCDVRNLLGCGGMGSVYLAWQHGLEREIAVKVLPPSAVRKGNAQARFSREISALGRLNHPGIVTAFDAGQCNGIHYLLMEYVDGYDLAKIVSSHGALTMADACEVIRQTAVALQCAHEKELVHRDLKPSNLMVTRSGLVKILDLGLAKLRNSNAMEVEISDSFELLGTIDYMAPELADHQNSANIRTDIFSLGATLFELLVGQSPLEAAGNSMTMQKLTALSLGELPDIRDHRQDTPKMLAAIVDRMLASKPQHRFATPADVADAIAPFCEGHHLTKLSQLPKPAATSSAETQVESAAVTTTISPAGKPVKSVGDRNIQRQRRTLKVVAIPVIALLSVLTISTVDWNRQPDTASKQTAVVPSTAPKSPSNSVEPNPKVSEELDQLAIEDLKAAKTPLPKHQPELTNNEVPELTPEVARSQREFAEAFVSETHPLRVATDGKRPGPNDYCLSIRELPKKPFAILEVFYFGSDATDGELTELANAKLPYLETLKFFNEPQVTPVGLSAVAKGYPRLKHLSVGGLTRPYNQPGLTPEQLLPVVEEFRELERIEILLVRDTDAEVWCRGLSQMESLKNVVFSKMPLGESLVHLRNLPNLQEMELYHLPLPDEDVQYLKLLRNLRTLRLRGVRKLSPAGLNQLKELSSLKNIKISKTHPRDKILLGSVSRDDLVAFARAVPGLTIEVEQRGEWVAIVSDESLEDDLSAEPGS